MDFTVHMNGFFWLYYIWINFEQKFSKYHPAILQTLWKITKENKKSRIRETKHLSTDADSSTDTKKILLVRQNLPTKTIFFWGGDFIPFISKSFQI